MPDEGRKDKNMLSIKGNGFAPVPPSVDANGITAKDFADTLFEFEYCGECHGDIKDHDFVIGPFGAWFAVCKREHVTRCKVCR